MTRLPTGLTRLPRILGSLLLTTAAATHVPAAPALRALPEPDSLFQELATAIGGRRIVLLGENGHGVAEFTRLKAGLVRYLHERLGFSVLAMESGYWECTSTGAELPDLSASSAIRGCLTYAMEHTQLIPLFDYLKERIGTRSPLVLSGIDLQLQSGDSRFRPGWLRAELSTHLPDLADTLVLIDSALMVATAAGPETVDRWVLVNGPAAREAYDSAARMTIGPLHWTLRTSSALLARLESRAMALRTGTTIPTAFWGRRDQWMAETVKWLADSGSAARKVVVWLHNDHGRYGSWTAPTGRVPAAGGLLREAFQGNVFSVGFFMGAGVANNNSRHPHDLAPMDSQGLESTLRGAGSGTRLQLLDGPCAPAWASQPRPYRRNGLILDTLTPSAEFDALIYVDRVTAPTYVVQ